MRLLLISALLTVLSACSHTKIAKEELTGCEHPSGWCKEIRDTAQEVFIFAQMAANAYDEAAKFTLPAEYSLVEAHDNDSIGFAYSVYKDSKTNTVIISFRGTEGFKYWWYGNILALQNDAWLKVYNQLKNKHPENTNFVVVGHSLGGAIALEVSLKRDHVDAYVFNTSPRFNSDRYRIENKRASIVEHGEILKALRAPSREASQKYTSIGCSSGGPVSQYEQLKLATCLTQIAATQSDVAKESLNNNGVIYWHE